MTKVGHHPPPGALAIRLRLCQLPVHLSPKLQWLMLALEELL